MDTEPLTPYAIFYLLAKPIEFSTIGGIALLGYAALLKPAVADTTRRFVIPVAVMARADCSPIGGSLGPPWAAACVLSYPAPLCEVYQIP